MKHIFEQGDFNDYMDMSCPTNEQLIAIRKLNTLTSNIV